MKVVLLEDVANLGNRYEIKNVSDGFALNFLIPQKKAKFADEKTISEIEGKKAQSEALRKEMTDKILGEISKAKGKEIKVTAKASKAGHLFAGLDTSKIAEILSNEFGVNLKPSNVKLDSPIKEIGEHEVIVVAGEKEASVKVVVEAE
jgi:large subunit ribosomal protein L9